MHNVCTMQMRHASSDFSSHFRNNCLWNIAYSSNIISKTNATKRFGNLSILTLFSFRIFVFGNLCRIAFCFLSAFQLSFTFPFCYIFHNKNTYQSNVRPFENDSDQSHLNHTFRQHFTTTNHPTHHHKKNILSQNNILSHNIYFLS